MERTKLGTMALAGSYGGAVLGMPVSGGLILFSLQNCSSQTQVTLRSGSDGMLRSMRMVLPV